MLKPKIITLRNEREYKCIDLDKLHYICIDDYLCNFYLEKNCKFTCTKSLTELEHLLPGNFYRINRNCIVNIYAIDSICNRNRTIILSNNAEFTISYRRQRQLNILLTNHNTSLTS